MEDSCVLARGENFHRRKILVEYWKRWKRLFALRCITSSLRIFWNENFRWTICGSLAHFKRTRAHPRSSYIGVHVVFSRRRRRKRYQTRKPSPSPFVDEGWSYPRSEILRAFPWDQHLLKYFTYFPSYTMYTNICMYSNNHVFFSV